nr:MAG TPA: hypothetical protein [Caudoviricetes sp.]
MRTKSNTSLGHRKLNCGILLIPFIFTSQHGPQWTY